MHGRTPTQLLADRGLTGPTVTAVHATHLTDTDRTELGDSGTGVCFCPTTERDLADGIGHARALVDAGSPLSLGSDSHAVIDLFEEARGVEMHERLHTEHRGHFTAAELLTAATTTGHASLGWTDAGGITPGARADLVTVSLTSPRTAGCTPASILFTATAADIQHVVIDGRVTVRDGIHVTVPDVGAALTAALHAVDPSTAPPQPSTPLTPRPAGPPQATTPAMTPPALAAPQAAEPLQATTPGTTPPAPAAPQAAPPLQATTPGTTPPAPAAPQAAEPLQATTPGTTPPAPAAPQAAPPLQATTPGTTPPSEAGPQAAPPQTSTPFTAPAATAGPPSTTPPQAPTPGTTTPPSPAAPLAVPRVAGPSSPADPQAATPPGPATPPTGPLTATQATHLSAAQPTAPVTGLVTGARDAAVRATAGGGSLIGGQR
ncbi:hypothetical protein GCM10027610_107560 [Dactylosporangium cerinum]